MNSKYHRQKSNSDSFKDQVDSDEDRIQIDTVNSNQISLEKDSPEKETQYNSPFVMTIEIDKGLSEKLQIYYDSVPEEVAYEFCKKHNLDYTALSYLIDEIKTVLNPNKFDEQKENGPIQEEEEESLVSEDNGNKNSKSDELLNPILKESNVSSKNNDKLSKEILIKEEINKNDNITNAGNKSTCYNENNHTEIFSKTFSNINDNPNVLYTEPTLKESSFGRHSVNNSAMIQNKKKLNLGNKKDLNSIERKLFSYQIFLDKYKSNNVSITTLNNSNNKSIKNLSTNVSVFEKLYREAKQRKKNQVRVSHHYLIKKNSNDYLQGILGNKVNKQIMKQIDTSSSSKINQINIGEKLYHKGLNLKEGVEAKISNQRKEQMDKNKEIYTFKPNLAKTNYNNLNYTSTNEDSILARFEQYKRNKDLKMKILRENYEEKGNYSFVPKINENSINIVNSKYNMTNDEDDSKNHSEKIDKHRELYELARLKPIKMKNLEFHHYGQFNYQPSINKNDTQYSDFFTRQESFSKKKTENLLKQKEEINVNIDRMTGQRLFSPKIKSVSLTRNLRNIYEHLYSLDAKQRDRSSSQNQKQFTEILNKSNKLLTDNNTHTIFDDTKTKIFKRLFKILDSDECGEISIFCINLRKISEKMKKIMEPVVYQMKEWGVKFKEEKFIIECDKLFNNMSIENRNIFLSFPKDNLTKSQSCTRNDFKPKINSYSRLLDNSRKKKNQSKQNEKVHPQKIKLAIVY